LIEYYLDSGGFITDARTIHIDIWYTMIVFF
jgi:hypothetical protein